MDKTQTFITNEDGSFTLKTTDEQGTATEVKAVKESDLLAVKGGAEKEKADMQGQVAEANRVKAETHQQLLEAKAASEQFEVKAKESVTLTAKVTELETNLSAAKESSKGLEDQLLGRVRTHLVELYKVGEDTVKDKDLVQLGSYEEALKAVGGAKAAPANYDKGGGGGTPSAPTSVLEGAKQELVLARELQRKRAAGTDPDDKP